MLAGEGALSLVMTVEGKAVRLSSREKWARAIQQGDLNETTVVDVETDGRPVRTCVAREVQELQEFFAPGKLERDASIPAVPAAVPPAMVEELPDNTPDEVVEPQPGEQTFASPAKSEGDEGNPWVMRIAVALGIGIVIAFVRMMSAGSTAETTTMAPESNSMVVEAAAPTGKSVAFGELVNWSAELAPGDSTYLAGDLKITMSAAELPEDGAAPKLTVEAYGLAPREIVGSEGRSPASGSFLVGQLDPSTPEPEIIFTSFSGGAHCCTQVTVLQRDGDTWRSIELGQWDGDPIGEWPKDINGDATPDLVVKDERFLYAFASYAASFAPPLIINVNGGKASNVSADASYNSVFESRISDAEASCKEKNNGACAAFVAIAARLGRDQQGWDLMLENYDPTFEWDLPSGCRVDPGEAACPTALQMSFTSFPEALQYFLKDTGYLPATFNSASAAADGAEIPY